MARYSPFFDLTCEAVVTQGNAVVALFTPGAKHADKVALDALTESLQFVTRWSKDTTEASRRRAYAAARIVSAVMSVLPKNDTRGKVAAYAAALEVLTHDADPVKTLVECHAATVKLDLPVKASRKVEKLRKAA